VAVPTVYPQDSMPAPRRGRRPAPETALRALEGEAFSGCADCRLYEQTRLMRRYHDLQHDRLLTMAKARAREIGALDIVRMLGLAEQHDALEDGEAEAGDGLVACAHGRFRQIASAVEMIERGRGGPCGVVRAPMVDDDGCHIQFDPCGELGGHDRHVFEIARPGAQP
jgi:hypothetical protein